MRPMRKSERDKFAKGVIAFLESLGAKPTADGWYQYTLETPLGKLLFSLSDNTTGGPGSVMCRFDEPDRAIALGCNPYTGKWNRHYFDGWTTDAAMADFSRAMSALMQE